MFLKNKNIIFKIRRSKVTDYAALNDPQLALSVATFLPFLVLVYALDLLA